MPASMIVLGSRELLLGWYPHRSLPWQVRSTCCTTSLLQSPLSSTRGLRERRSGNYILLLHFIMVTQISSALKKQLHAKTLGCSIETLSLPQGSALGKTGKRTLQFENLFRRHAGFERRGCGINHCEKIGALPSVNGLFVAMMLS